MQEKDETALMYERITPFITILYTLMGEIPQDKIQDCANPQLKGEVVHDVVVKLLTEMVKSELKASDVDYIFSVIYTILDAIKSGLTDTLNENTSRISEVIYGLPVNGLNNLTVKQVNDVFQRIDKIKEVWTPVLDDKSLEKEIE